MSATTSVVALLDQPSAGAIKSKANYIAAQSQGLEDGQIHAAAAAALSNLQDQINTLVKALRAGVSITTTATPVPPPLTSFVIAYNA